MVPGDADSLLLFEGYEVVQLAEDVGEETYEHKLHVGILQNFQLTGHIIGIA